MAIVHLHRHGLLSLCVDCAGSCIGARMALAVTHVLLHRCPRAAGSWSRTFGVRGPPKCLQLIRMEQRDGHAAGVLTDDFCLPLRE